MLTGTGLPTGRQPPRKMRLNFTVNIVRVLVFSWLHMHPDILQLDPSFSFFCFKL